MSNSPGNFSTGWKIAIVAAVLGVLANGGASSLLDNKYFRNHEDRIDQLENAVFGNDIGSAPREDSHQQRIKKLERQIRLLEEDLSEASVAPAE